ncbi:hypothetical protein [Gordonia rhizosphera]|uniref:GH16 domain-containing protein n=1 Tax=Gordonia rhizosphera NBRC 16068 TaxID=1108045 RepID=K6WQ20_9ACTN|nr:hypothetical protein [Gordonia rhizosphera]GAB88639.1 hypothetical protein GORHZ_034_00050 [Gordonia rhizosphera NBRC 16068]
MQHKPVVRGLVSVTAATMLAWVGSGGALADPNIQIPGVDDGVPNCAVLRPRGFAGYIGTNDPKPARTMDEDFTHVPNDWCNTSVGYSRLWFDVNGVTFGLPDTLHALFPYNNAELLAKPVFEPGWTMTMRVGGTQKIPTWAGTTGWGVSNRSVDPIGLELAWFMYNGANDPVGDASTLAKPIMNALGMDFPRGFFMMTKRAGGLPQIRLLPLSILNEEHDYSVVLTDRDVTFYIDGEQAGTDVAPFVVDGRMRGGPGSRYGTFGNPPVGTHVDISGQPVPLLGQMWLDSGYWFPLPIPQVNDRWQTAYLKRYVQGPTDRTPLTLDGWQGFD